jgi:hypothetical protein
MLNSCYYSYRLRIFLGIKFFFGRDAEEDARQSIFTVQVRCVPAVCMARAQ